MSSSTCPSCLHVGDYDHIFIRCGCPNDYPDTHPMHINDDAFHHVWCNLCLKYCYKKPACPFSLPSTHVVRPAKQRLRDTYVHPFATYRVLLYGQGMDPQTCLNPISDSQKEVLEDGYLDPWGEITLVVAQEEEKEDAESEDL